MEKSFLASSFDARLFNLDWFSDCLKFQKLEETQSSKISRGWKLRSISYESLGEADLVVDAVYQSDRQVSGGSIAGEPLSKLMSVGNLGGFRLRNGQCGTLFAVITSTGVEAEWPDNLDPYSGIYTYFGDNRTPGAEMHKTKQRGNLLLKKAFELAHSEQSQDRQDCPVFFIFEWAGQARDHIFRGMAIPGSEYLAPGEDLVAVWRTVNGERFQNYRASLTILNEGVISGLWLRNSIKAGRFLLDDPQAPKTYVDWVWTGRIQPLLAEKIGPRSKGEQLPKDSFQEQILNVILQECSSDPGSFELLAAEIWKISCPSPVQYELTPRYKDGGRDALGTMHIGPNSDSVKLTFALEAKLYNPSNSVGVKEVSRLISRIKHREFGVFVTTSALHAQVYREIREDQHPVVVITGRDIVEILAANGITTPELCKRWITKTQSKS